VVLAFDDSTLFDQHAERPTFKRAIGRAVRAARQAKDRRGLHDDGSNQLVRVIYTMPMYRSRASFLLSAISRFRNNPIGRQPAFHLKASQSCSVQK
jgi:hypothetical protein